MTDFIWKGQKIDTIGTIFTALSHLENEQEGADFMLQYIDHLSTSDEEGVANNAVSVAVSNVGYVARYGSDETYERITKFTGTYHPIFG